MTRNDDEEFDFFKVRVRGSYIKHETYNFGGSRQAFVKITGRSYSSKKVVATLDYIGIESDGVGKETRVLDENDNVVLPDEYQSAVKDWRFNETVEQRNESKKSNQHKARDEIIAQMGTPLSLDRVGIEQVWQKIYNLTEIKKCRQEQKRTLKIER